MSLRARASLATALFLCVSLHLRVDAHPPDRRKFITGLASAGSLGVGMGSSWAGSKVVFDRLSEDAPEYSRTVLEQNLYKIGELITINLLEKYFGEGTFGNSGMTEDHVRKMLENPVKFWADATLVTPAIEEILMRLLPASFFGTGWVTGTISAGAFAAMHGLEKIPLGQFAGGIWLWYLLKHRGLSHAILAHAANNHAVAAQLIITEALGVRRPEPEPPCAKGLGKSRSSHP